MKKISSLLSTIIFCLVLLIIPVLIGGIISYFMGDLIYLEVMLVLFGLLELLVFVTNGRRRDSKNFKKNKTLYEDKTTKEYKGYKMSQWMILALGIITVLSSLIVFYIGR